MPTTREISQLLDVDLRTLTSVLNDLEAENVIVRRDRSGMYVSPKIHRKSIAVVFNSSLLGTHASPFWGALMSHFALLAEQRGQSANQDFEFFMTSPAAESDGAVPDHLKRSIRAGAINGVVGIGLSIDSARWLLDQGVPVTTYAVLSKLTVVTGGEGLLQTGLQALADQGCRRVEYWGLPRPDDNNPGWYEQTRRAVETAYRDVGLNLPQTVVGPAEDLFGGFHGQPLSYRGYTAVKALFRDPARPKPDGMFIGDDTMASGILLGLMESGIRVGEDIKIVSHANRASPILFGAQRNLTLLEFDPAEIADALINLLDQAMADPDMPETQISVPWRVRLPEDFE